MAIKSIKVLTSHTLEELKDNFKNLSARYKFKDAFTDKLADINKLYTKDDYLSTNARLSKGGYEYDSLVVELENSPNLELEVKTVLDAFSKPDFSWAKDPGGGRAIQKVEVKGTRPVYYDLHEEKNGTYHLHLKVFRYSINKDKLSLAPNSHNRVQEAQEEYLKTKLNEKNLPFNSVVFANTIRTTNQTASMETKNQIAGLQEELKENPKALETLLDTVIDSTSIDHASLSITIEDKSKTLAKALQNIKEIQNEILILKSAENVLLENNQLREKTKALEADNLSLAEEIEAKNELIELERHTHEEEIISKNLVISANNQTILEYKESYDVLATEYNTLQEDLKEVNQANSAIANQLEKEQETTNLQREIITTNKSSIESLKQEAATLKSEVVAQQQENILLQDEIETQKAEAAAQQQTITRLQDEIKELKADNFILSNTVLNFSNLIDKLITSYDNFANTVKDKIKTIPDIKKELVQVFKEKTTVINATNKKITEPIENNQDVLEAQKKILETMGNKPNLSEAQKKIIEIMRKRAEEEKPEDIEEDNQTSRFKPK